MGHGDDDSIAAGAAYGYSVERSIVHYRGVQGGAGKGGLSVSSTLGSISVFPPMLSAFNAELADYGLQ